MKVLHDWLKDYLGDALPSAERVEELLTFHSFEIDGVETDGEHTVIDVDVLPNRSSDCLCHRGIAREIATLTGVELIDDPFTKRPEMPVTDRLSITISDPVACRHFDLALLDNVHVGPSPEWLKSRLQALGQRSINNVVDATNYVMLSLGQPLHAYDANTFKQENNQWHFGVRFAKASEKITTLTGEEYELDSTVQLIVNGATDEPAGIAGVKGGKYAEVSADTTTIILEAASFDPTITRKTAQKLKLQTDASKRFENNVSSEVAPYALYECVKLISEIAGGTIVGYAHEHPTKITNTEVTVELDHINALLGLSLGQEEVESIFTRLGFTYTSDGSLWRVVAPFERTDIEIAENVIEEVGRVYGYDHIASITPEENLLTEYNARHYYSEQIRDVLVRLGFSEVITSTFRKKDAIHLLNALASDKGSLRSSLQKNIVEVLDKNMPNVDLLGTRDVRVFEIGTVFQKSNEGNEVVEVVMVAVGARTKQQGFVPKDNALLEEVRQELEEVLGVAIEITHGSGVFEFSLGALLAKLPVPTAYGAFVGGSDTQFKPFSTYPFVSRDIALWTDESVDADAIEAVLRDTAGELCVRVTLFDAFKKEGKVSYAFRLIFQSDKKTLTDTEVNALMERITAAISECEWEVR